MAAGLKFVWVMPSHAASYLKALARSVGSDANQDSAESAGISVLRPTFTAFRSRHLLWLQRLRTGDRNPFISFSRIDLQGRMGRRLQLVILGIGCVVTY